MKFFKWLFVGLFSLVLLAGAAGAALVYLVDWNDFRDTIQNQVKKQTGRDMTIAGDLKPTVFPWLGVSLGEIELANAVGFGDIPFARMGGADVKVKLMPLLKKEVNVKTVELHGLTLDLQRNADGTTNWDDLVAANPDEPKEDSDASADESSAPAIESLQVDGINISNAQVSWRDNQAGTDVRLSDFNLSTGAVSLAEPFDLKTDFSLASDSMGLSSAVKGAAEIQLDLDNQVYTVNGLSLTTDARGETLPNGAVAANVVANIVARMNEQTVAVSGLTLDALGISLSGDVDVVNLDTKPQVTGQLASNEFKPLDLFRTLGIEPPVTADPSVLGKASLQLALRATPDNAELNDLTIRLDDTTFTGKASVPSLAAEIPPLRFDFSVDAIDLDRYLPPQSENADAAKPDEPDTGAAVSGDEPIALPLDTIRKLDVDGVFNVGSVKVSNLTTSNIAVPVVAKNGTVTLNGIRASMYDGQLDSTVKLDATGDIPGYSANLSLNGIQADPLLTDLLEKTSFLSGAGQIQANIETRGESVNGLKSNLNGTFDTSFNDGFIRGVNVGYQLRRARAAFSGNSLSAAEEQVKTDFTAMSISGRIVNGVVQSDNLDMRSPLLRLSGAGQVDLPQEYVDYTLNTLFSGTSEGQGGAELEALKGVKLAVPIRGKFDELSADFSGVLLAGLKQNITDNLTSQAKARAEAEAQKLKLEAETKLKAEEARARERLAAEEAKARAKLEAEQARIQEQVEEQKSALEDKANEAIKKNKDKVKNQLKGLFK